MLYFCKLKLKVSWHSLFYMEAVVGSEWGEQLHLSGFGSRTFVCSQILAELPQLRFASNNSIRLRCWTRMLPTFVIAKSKHQRIASVCGCGLTSTSKKHAQLRWTDDCLYFSWNLVFPAYYLIISNQAQKWYCNHNNLHVAGLKT